MHVTMLSKLLALAVTRYFRKVYAVKVQVLGNYRKLVISVSTPQQHRTPSRKTTKPKILYKNSIDALLFANSMKL